MGVVSTKRVCPHGDQLEGPVFVILCKYSTIHRARLSFGEHSWPVIAGVLLTSVYYTTHEKPHTIVKGPDVQLGVRNEVFISFLVTRALLMGNKCW
jgi:hypothetical protein